MAHTIFTDERLGHEVSFEELESLDFFDFNPDTLYDIEYEENTDVYMKIEETGFNAIDIRTGKLIKFSSNTAVRPLKAKIIIEGMA